MTHPPPSLADAREQFLALVAGVRPELHRYCARLTGSVIEGEDLVQETLAKALYALSLSAEVPPLRPWLFRVAHNAALDHLRSHAHKMTELPADIEDRTAPRNLVPIWTSFHPAGLRCSSVAWFTMRPRRALPVGRLDVHLGTNFRGPQRSLRTDPCQRVCFSISMTGDTFSEASYNSQPSADWNSWPMCFPPPMETYRWPTGNRRRVRRACAP